MLAPADDEFGMRELGGKFIWKLNDWQAARIAERIELLTPQDNKSGSEILEVGSEGEIPVKVSRGEFTDDFLIDPAITLSSMRAREGRRSRSETGARSLHDDGEPQMNAGRSQIALQNVRTADFCS